MKQREGKAKKIEELLNRGVEEIIDKENLEQKLKSGRKLRVKLGIDPTSPNLHIGRSIPLLKLRDFQELGHKIVFIIGDFTGIIGDTSDKESERPMLTKEMVKKNLKTYIKQASKIINIEDAEIYHNSEWLGKLGYGEIGRQANIFSLNEFISRENIKKRLDLGKRVSLRELLYPLMQGYDSVSVKADVEVGGTDQRFNLLAGRVLQKSFGQESQDIIMNPIVEGLDGRKMSSSFGNTINLLDTPDQIFGKIMSLSDEFIIKYFILLTRVPLDEISSHEAFLKEGGNPRDIKLKLAFEIVRMYHTREDAQNAQSYFIETFSKKKLPDHIQEMNPERYDIVSILVQTNWVSSKSSARRLLLQGGVKVDGVVIKDPDFILDKGSILQKGKMYFMKIV